MSHAVTITRTTTTTTSAIILNTGYFKTLPGLLKLAEVLLGAVCVGIVSYYSSRYRDLYIYNAELFFMLMTVAFLVGSTCLFLSCLLSLSTASIISKTLYEFLYHGVAFILYLSCSLTLLIEVNNKYKGYHYEPYLAAAIIGLINTALYLLSAIFGYRNYRGI